MNPEQECREILTKYLSQIDVNSISTKTDVKMVVNNLRNLQYALIAVSWKEESNKILQKLGGRT
jgi:hypothetical protein